MAPLAEGPRAPSTPLAYRVNLARVPKKERSVIHSCRRHVPAAARENLGSHARATARHRPDLSVSGARAVRNFSKFWPLVTCGNTITAVSLLRSEVREFGGSVEYRDFTAVYVASGSAKADSRSGQSQSSHSLHSMLHLLRPVAYRSGFCT